MKEPPVKEGEEYTLKVESVGAKGDGVAKLQGYTIFIPGGKADEEYMVKITKVFPSYAFSEVINESEQSD